MKASKQGYDDESVGTSTTTICFDSDDSDHKINENYATKKRHTTSSSFKTYTSVASPPRDELIVFGFNLSEHSPKTQFILCTSGVFFFNMLYGALQELIQIQIANRKFALFLAASQFAGYAFWSAVLSKLRTYRLMKMYKSEDKKDQKRSLSDESLCLIPNSFTTQGLIDEERNLKQSLNEERASKGSIALYLALSVIRAIDLGLTNLSMKFLNYPAKTLMKSSRVIFTMLLGSIIGRKKYKDSDYIMCVLLVSGLCIFFHADMTTSAVFHPYGVVMLVTSLALDATVSNSSELIMRRHSIGQDEFQMRLFFLSFLVMLVVSQCTGELVEGMEFFFMKEGTMHDLESISNQEYWSPSKKAFALFLFSTMGTFGGSCACAITKRFGALTMAIVTTSRKAATLCLSFLIFPNVCTFNHVLGMILFISGLVIKSLVRGKGRP